MNATEAVPAPAPAQNAPPAPEKDQENNLSDAQKEKLIQDAKDKKKKEEQAARRRVKPKQGDYQVQVHFIECRDVKARGLGNQCEPVGKVLCQVGAKERTAHTKCADDVTCSFKFDEIFVFEFEDVSPQELESSKLTLSIYDSKTDISQLRAVHIGSFSFDLMSIYYRDDHEQFRQWIAIVDHINPKKYPGIQGYILASITVLGPGDTQKIREKDADYPSEDVLMPPAGELVSRQLNVMVGKCEGLPKMDDIGFGSNVQPYVLVEFAGQACKNKPKDGNFVEFNESLGVPVFEPVMANTISVSIMDCDLIGENERICTVSIEYLPLRDSELAPRWFHLYGTRTPAPIAQKSPNYRL
jgi:hypothetical protein